MTAPLDVYAAPRAAVDPPPGAGPAGVLIPEVRMWAIVGLAGLRVGSRALSAAMERVLAADGRVGELVELLVHGLASLLAGPFFTVPLLIQLVFMSWMYRVVDNARLLGMREGWTPRAAVIWWIVPVVNLLTPYFILRATWRASAGAPADAWAPWWLVVWWVVVVLRGSALYLLLVGRYDLVMGAPWWLSWAATFAEYGLMSAVVLRITALQRARTRR